MHWLIDLVVELVASLPSWKSRHVDRSVVGESRLDRGARRIGIALLVGLVLLVGGWLYFRR
jgi:hypothetical protein